jgi:hypothetical protein
MLFKPTQSTQYINCNNTNATCETNANATNATNTTIVTNATSVKGFESYNMGLFVLYYETFGYDVDREVKPYYKILFKILTKIF